MQLDLIPPVAQEIPTLEVLPWPQTDANLGEQLELSRLRELEAPTQIWTSSASTRELQYATHGLYRFFGKFPPPVARYLITRFCREADVVLDPMCGSGTTGVEALLLGRSAELADVNPFSILLARAKTRYIPQGEILDARDQVRQSLRHSEGHVDTSTPGLKNADHWFLESTIQSLARIRYAVEHVAVKSELQDLLKVVFASVVRRVSRATTQQGRLFLDAATAIEDAEPLFFEKLDDAARTVAALPREPQPVVHQRSAAEPIEDQYPLIICHPPYYNSYRYSSINTLELAWLRMSPKEIRQHEVREAFKVGKPEKVHDYLADMSAVLRNLSRNIKRGGTLALMIGDTVLRKVYVPVTRLLLERVPELRAKLVAFRVPKFTEASWVASQRRNGDQVGVTMCDYIILLEPR